MYHKPSNLEFQQIFDSIATKYDDITNDYAVKRRINFFKEFAKGKCLEIGAGTAEISKALKNQHQVIATDISPKMVDQIKKKLKIPAYVCDAEKLPFTDNSFDTIIGAEMIYYLDNPQNFINEASRVLKAGGRILLSSANDDIRFYDSLRAVFRKLGIGSMYFDDQNRKFISSSELIKLLKKGGFRIDQMRKVMIIPIKNLQWLDKILEKTPLSFFGIFIFVSAEKDEKK